MSFLPLLAFFLSLFPPLSEKETQWIGERIWQNECGKTIKGLTSWNEGEEFASLGIGHFIWYSKDKSKNFVETFPQLLIFLKKNGATIPDWLLLDPTCPWASRQEFLNDQKSEKMEQLRSFLTQTIGLQTLFILKQFETAIIDLEKSCKKPEKDSLKEKIKILSATPQGIFALIDYVNFKGVGLSKQESYQGNGWGLLQVLQNMPIPKNDREAVGDFVQSAKEVLRMRVQNSIQERNEKRWLPGWEKRLEGYLIGPNYAV